jgi:pimeloyl-ACP methyl ester carboxylesterase
VQTRGWRFEPAEGTAIPGTGVPVVFIHGLWWHSTSWQLWVDRFREACYNPVTPEWPRVPDQPERGIGTGAGSRRGAPTALRVILAR